MDTDRSGIKAIAEKAKQFCTFWLSGRLLGVDILHVKEVNPEAEFTTIPHAPDEVIGFVNIRGQIHLILDLKRVLGLPSIATGEKSRLVLFKPSVGEAFGVQVDQIGDVVEVPESTLEAGAVIQDELRPEDNVDISDLISGVCRLESTLLLVVNARNLLAAVDHAPK
ncbi:MAG: hypothetical protein D6E12_04370 [Desulfovibrio sp.]|nr:MAG: hypothetical protein D6E12_04370 [Desulfovibrio sp.]